MKKKFSLLIIAVLTIIALAACGTSDEKEKTESGEGNDDKLKVVTSLTIIEDMAKEIGGDLVEVYNLVPTGTDPHEYETLPDDTKAETDADVLLYNGLNLEDIEHGWFSKLKDTFNQDCDFAHEQTEYVEPMYITSEDGKDE